MPFEPPRLPLPSLRRVWRDLGLLYAVNGLIALVFSASGPVAIVLAVGSAGGLSEAEMASWIFGCFFFNGLITLAFCLLYRQPLAFFWTIPGTVLVGPALQHLSFAEVIGAFYATGLLMIVLGLTGWVRLAMEAVPKPIVMAMVAGVFLQFGLEMVQAFQDGFWIAAPMAAVFLLLSALRSLGRRLPPLIGALLAGVCAVALTGGLDPGPDTLWTIAQPVLHRPEFSWQAMLELVVPLAITVLVVQNGQGFAVLSAAGHRPPMNAIASACGLGALASAAVGAAPTCLTGPSNAILTSSGEKERHYTAGLTLGLLALLLGLLSPLFTGLMLATPGAFIATLAGLAMLRVLQTAFTTAFQGRFSLGALISFLVTVSGLSIAGIGAPFWGLVFGFAIAAILESGDFKKGAREPD